MENHYEFLGLEPFASREEIAETVERLSRQASAIANTNPARSQAIIERLRQIKYDLLTTDERRYAYDNTLLDAQHAAGGAGEEVVSSADSTGTPPPRYSRPVQRPETAAPASARHGFPAKPLVILAGVLVLLLLGGGGFVVAHGALGPAATPTPTATPKPTATPRPTATPKPTATLRPLPTATARVIVVTPTPVTVSFTPTPVPDNSAAKEVADAIVAYSDARQAAFSQDYDTSNLSLTTSGEAYAATMCTLDGSSGSLESTQAYFTYQPIHIGDPQITVNGNTATATEYKQDVETLHRENGTTDTIPETFTVTYHLTNDGGSWTVDNYSWVTPGGGTGSATKDADTCSS